MWLSNLVCYYISATHNPASRAALPATNNHKAPLLHRLPNDASLPAPRRRPHVFLQAVEAVGRIRLPTCAKTENGGWCAWKSAYATHGAHFQAGVRRSLTCS